MTTFAPPAGLLNRAQTGVLVNHAPFAPIACHQNIACAMLHGVRCASWTQPSGSFVAPTDRHDDPTAGQLGNHENHFEVTGMRRW
jgi:hypothetical protein